MKAVVLSKLDELLESQWEMLFDHALNPFVMQSPFAWHLFNNTKNFKPILVGCYDDDRLVGLLLAVLIRESSGIKGFFSSRVIIYGGPLLCRVLSQQEQVVSELFDALIKEVQEKSIFIQLRASYDFKMCDGILKSLGFSWAPRLNLLINTSDHNEVFKGMSASRRRQIRKSIKNGAEIRGCNSESELYDFYTILKQLYREKVRKPLPDFTFFKSFYQLARETQNGKILLVHYERKVVGGIIFPFREHDAVYEWYVCGLDHELKFKGIYPSVLATWAAIDFAINNNIGTFDFMGVGKPDEPYGVRDFKLRFGGKIVNYGRYIRINNKLIYTIAELGYNVMSMLKKV
jgi:lipid II:glycine glycyltransferase (peptidoglycan interpeptide bridge formation enzyme)